LRDVQIAIANGSDTNRYRDVAADALDRLRQLLQFELHYDVTISNWDYRRVSPRTRSLAPRARRSSSSTWTTTNIATSSITFPTQRGYDRDEYPPAMTDEGGKGASVRYVAKRREPQRRGVMKGQLHLYCNEQRFIFERWRNR
jgi:hypothetical protein